MTQNTNAVAPRAGATVEGLLGGFTKVVYWDREKVRAHAEKFSKAYNKADSPWTTNFDAMALKTVVRDALNHWGILSVQMQTAITLDQTVKKDLEEFPMPPRLPRGNTDSQGTTAT